MSTDTITTLDDYAMTLIRLKARELVGHYGFTKSDREDLQQDLTLDLLVRLDRFDPDKGRPATFVRMIVDRRVASLIRERTSLARDFRRAAYSLDELGAENGGDAVTEPTVDNQRQHDLEIDIAESLNGLPGGLRAIAEELRFGSLADAARKRRCSRDVIRRRVLEIRKRFARCGLDEYMPSDQFGRCSRK